MEAKLDYTPGRNKHGPQFKPGVLGRRLGMCLRRTGRGICTYIVGRFLKPPLCVCVNPHQPLQHNPTPHLSMVLDCGMDFLMGR